MKKKIKDLTLEECRKICEKQRFCNGCPFYGHDNHCMYVGDASHIDYEVEVDE